MVLLVTIMVALVDIGGDGGSGRFCGGSGDSDGDGMLMAKPTESYKIILK